MANRLGRHTRAPVASSAAARHERTHAPATRPRASDSGCANLWVCPSLCPRLRSSTSVATRRRRASPSTASARRGTVSEPSRKLPLQAGVDLDRLCARLRAINAVAPQLRASHSQLPVASILNRRAYAREGPPPLDAEDAPAYSDQRSRGHVFKRAPSFLLPNPLEAAHEPRKASAHPVGRPAMQASPAARAGVRLGDDCSGRVFARPKEGLAERRTRLSERSLRRLRPRRRGGRSAQVRHAASARRRRRRRRAGRRVRRGWRRAAPRPLRPFLPPSRCTPTAVSAR